MSASLSGSRELPASQYDLSTYWGRVKQSAEIADPRTLFVSSAGLENAKTLVSSYKTGEIKMMTPEIWKAKKIVDSTLHPDTGQPVFLPFRMSCYVICNLVVTAGMLTPNLGTPGTLLWQIANQSLNVGINTANANKSTPLSTAQLGKSYLLAVSASCSVAVGLNAVVPRLKRLAPTTRTILGRLVPFAAVATAGALNVFLMRAEEIRQGIDVYPAQPPHSITTSSSSIDQKPSTTAPVSSSPQTPPTPTQTPQSLGKSRIAALHAVSQTAISRILNATPIMVIPPLLLIQLQRRAAWLKNRPGLVTPVNLVLILTTSVFALPLALGAFPQRQKMGVGRLEKEFWDRGGETGEVEFNRGI